MSQIWRFHGGIHPPENKAQSLKRPLTQLSLPEQLILPLQQHIGAPAKPLVKAGDRVLKGQPIAAPSGFVSAWLHAPTSGVIRELTERNIPHPSGLRAPCLILDVDGDERWIAHQGVSDFRALKKADLAKLIREAGLAGMGGAGFPTEIKLHLADDHIINTLIVNGVECEPYITADDLLMQERAEEIIRGVEIAAHLLNPTHILIGIEDNKPKAANAMRAAARASDSRIDVVVLPTKYPSGGERQLVKLLTGVEVPHGKLPADIGIVIQNVGTLRALHRAIDHGEPLISRITTLTGEAVNEPGNREVLIGTPVAHLLQDGGVSDAHLHRLIMGGPMMGFTLTDPGVPLVKTSNCIIAGSLAEFPPAPPAQNCIRCGACEQACPAELLPQQLLWFAKSGEHEKALAHNLLDCIECGACAYVCPSNIPLVQYYRHAKGDIRREQAEQRKAEQAKQRFEARNARIEAEAAEKAARRKARAEEAAKAQAAKRDASTRKTHPTPADPQAALKAAKTAAAVARTKLKKAEKALAEAQSSGDPNAPALRDELAVLQAKVIESENKLATLEHATPAKIPDLKALKLAAASARTKVSKTEKALADAEAKGLPSADKLRASLETLKAKADAAHQALQEAEAPPSPVTEKPAASAPSSADLKALKGAVAIARTKLKKAEKTLSETDDSPQPTLKAEITTLKQRLVAAEQALADATPAESPNAPSADLKALKSAAAIARTKLKKAEKALTEADESERAAYLATVEQQRAQVEKAQAALDAATAQE